MLAHGRRVRAFPVKTYRIDLIAQHTLNTFEDRPRSHSVRVGRELIGDPAATTRINTMVAFVGINVCPVAMLVPFVALDQRVEKLFLIVTRQQLGQHREPWHFRRPRASCLYHNRVQYTNAVRHGVDFLANTVIASLLYQSHLYT